MAATFPFYLHAMLEWYHTHPRTSPVVKVVRNRMVYTHIYKSDPKAPFRMHPITDVACFLPHATCLPFLPSRRRYPLGLYAVSDPKAGALFVVYPKFKSNRKKERAVFADHFSFVYDAKTKIQPRIVHLYQTEYRPTRNDIYLGLIDHTYRPLKDGTRLPLEGYATKAFSKFTKFERDLLDICRLPLCAPADDDTLEGGGRGVAGRASTPVSARLTRLLHRRSIRDIRLFGVAVPADSATDAAAVRQGRRRPLTWHYTCFLQLSDDDPVLGLHDLSFQVPDPSWRSAQHALIRCIKRMEQSPMAPAPEPSWLAQ
jgi:hypothetical protein